MVLVIFWASFDCSAFFFWLISTFSFLKNCFCFFSLEANLSANLPDGFFFFSWANRLKSPHLSSLSSFLSVLCLVAEPNPWTLDGEPKP
jgi:hypothetical protein